MIKFQVSNGYAGILVCLYCEILKSQFVSLLRSSRSLVTITSGMHYHSWSFLLFSSLPFLVALTQGKGSQLPTTSLSTAHNTTNLNASFWLENIEHRGIAAFQENSTYQVFRNVKEFGARGWSPPQWARVSHD